MIPDCIGSNTECLDMIDGAGDSISQRKLAEGLLKVLVRLPIGSRIEPIAKLPSLIDESHVMPETWEPIEI